MFTCNVCKASFTSRVTLNYHQTTVASCVSKVRPVFACTVDGCSTKYHRHDFLVQHQRRVHGILKNGIKRRPTLNRIRLPPSSVESITKIPGIREPIITKSVILNVTHPERDTAKFFRTLRPSLCKILHGAVQQHQQIMFDIALDAKVLQASEDPNQPGSLFEVKTFYSKDIALRSPVEVEGIIDVVIKLLVAESFDEVNKSPFNEIVQLEISISKLRPQVGGYMPAHPEIVASNAVVNIKNSDAYCFKWAILAGISADTKQYLNLTHSYEVSDIKKERIYYSNMIVNFSGLRFPMEVRNVGIFEQNNPTVSVNVFGVEEQGESCKIVGPLYRTTGERTKHINLLFYENKEKTACHYAWIRSLSRLLRKQLGEENTLLEICNTCLAFFTTNERLVDHKTNPANCNILHCF